MRFIEVYEYFPFVMKVPRRNFRNFLDMKWGQKLVTIESIEEILYCINCIYLKTFESGLDCYEAYS